VVALPAGTIAEEVVVEEAPPTRKRKTDPAANHVGPKDKVSQEDLQVHVSHGSM